MIRKARTKFASALLTAACLSCSCINLAGEWRYEEVGREASPDGIVDAVFVRGGGGATTGFVFLVFIVPRGTKFEEKHSLFAHERALFSADHQEGLKPEWKSPKFLEIRYNKARIFQFRNRWNSKDVQDYRYVVELRLVPTDPNSSLIERDKT